jgi:hypothetical protein
MNSLCILVVLLWMCVAPDTGSIVSVQAFSATSSSFPKRKSSFLRRQSSSQDNHENTPPPTSGVSRRRALQASTLLIGTTFASAAVAAVEEVPIQASWTAVDGLNSNENVVTFDPSAYRAVSLRLTYCHLLSLRTAYYNTCLTVECILYSTFPTKLDARRSDAHSHFSTGD